MITPTQAIGPKIPDSETLSRILRKSGNKKMMGFWRELICGNLVCIKTYYSFKPAKPFKPNKIPRSWYLEITLINVLGHIDRKLPISLKYFWAMILSLDRNDLNNFGPKSQPFQNNPYIRRDASTWRAIYGVYRCPE